MQLIVPYRGDTTIAGLVAQYEQVHPEVTDGNFRSLQQEDEALEIDFFTLPYTMHTDEVLPEIARQKQRPLRVAETLALGLCTRNGPIIGLGQTLIRGLMIHIVIASDMTVQLGGYKSNWVHKVRIPITPV